jgi:uncharacterized protein YbjT (DUF2867 family)
LIEKIISNSNIIFSTIGTSQSEVNGDNEAYRKIDFNIPLAIAKICKKKNIEKFLFISSAGASLKSNSFYLKLKGELKNELIALNLESLSIFRPSLLLGKRKKLD